MAFINRNMSLFKGRERKRRKKKRQQWVHGPQEVDNRIFIRSCCKLFFDPPAKLLEPISHPIFVCDAIFFSSVFFYFLITWRWCRAENWTSKEKISAQMPLDNFSPSIISQEHCQWFPELRANYSQILFSEFFFIIFITEWILLSWCYHSYYVVVFFFLFSPAVYFKITFESGHFHFGLDFLFLNNIIFKVQFTRG